MNRVEIKFILADESARLPEAPHMDVFACTECIIPARCSAVICTGLVAEIPEGYELLVRPKMGIASRYGVTVLNSPGVIHAGSPEPITVVLHNTGLKNYKVNVGDAVAHLSLNRVQEFKPVCVGLAPQGCKTGNSVLI